MKGTRFFSIRPLLVMVTLAVILNRQADATQVVEFNTDVLDVKERSRVDLREFSQAGYIMPGTYRMVIRINKNELPEQDVLFLTSDNDPNSSVPCVTHEMVNQLGLKDKAIRTLNYWHQEKCLDLNSLKGVTARGDLGNSSLYISVPQAYLEYTADNWDPPSRWDNGIAGVVFDYNINAQSYQLSDGNNTQSLSGNGTAGFNAGAWRFRADWQGGYNHANEQNDNKMHWDWSRYYAYRAIAALRAKLTVGENYLSSGIFDSFRYVGASLVSDDNMLPPNLRGYAPEVTGVAKTNARVTVSQQGRVIYETTVASGPFRIQDLNSATHGTLDVKIQEQDGTVRAYQINTASIPYLTRPGLLRYKLAAGKPSNYEHHQEGPEFALGEFSWGINNGWSLYGGSILGGSSYNALSIGIGHDLMALGALSFDITQSRARLPQQGELSGGSYRISYSKHFDRYNSQVTFAGYRFSERNFMSMSQYLDARYREQQYGNSRELYTVSLNKQFNELNLSANLQFSHQTYWDRPANDTYNLSLSYYFDLGRLKNLSLSMSAYRNIYNDTQDDGMYLSLSLPWGANGSLSYDTQYGAGGNSNMVGYYNRLDANRSYNIKAGMGAEHQAIGSGYFVYDGDMAQVTASAGYQGGQYSSFALGLQGGGTATAKGAALHRINTMDGTRMMVDTNGVAGVPVRGYGGVSHSNLFGKAVVGDVNSYYRDSISVDIDKLADNVEAPRSVVQGTLTEGAIGYRKFGVIAGEKGMAVIKLADGSTPPFGAIVTSKEQYQLGIVSDDGNVWLSGMKPGECMSVQWDAQTQCYITLPDPLPPLNNNLLLPCLVRATTPDSSQKTSTARLPAQNSPAASGH
ncbi:outer membrane usher protein [Enterobacter bugandensis]|uniref:outer membrane usher protein n=1 Tax=Enterobacter bugandensis TaxID=881260 RepID=UPI002005A3DD|nr:outer membrane usher protein [Enterobacter bugandensis]MCK6964557.1 outer membrane usher protein [Enterobacter bugandensis]